MYNLCWSNVHFLSADFSLIIAFNSHLREIDFSSLEEIRGGGFVMFGNPQLCYTGNFSNYLAQVEVA